MSLASTALATYESALATAPKQIAKASGSCWTGDSADLIGQLGYWLSSQLSTHSQRRVEQLTLSKFSSPSREIHLETGFIPFVKPPTPRGSVWLCQVPDWLVSVDQIQIGSRILDRGADFRLSGNLLIVSDNVVSSGVVGWNIVGQTFQPQRFWANVLGFTDFHPGSLKFYHAVVRAGRDGLTHRTLADLVSAATGVDCVRVDSIVREIRTANPNFPHPMIITDHETISGPHSDVAVVSVGDRVAAGDFVFSSVRLWDCQEPVPTFINQLKIWPSYFSFDGTGPVTLTSTPSAPTFQTIDGKTRTRYSLTGDIYDVAAYFAAQDAREDASGISFAQVLARDPSPVIASLTAPQNWIEVLWDIWLRHGAVVTYISSNEAVAPEVDFRLQQIRRCIPPWITHLIQYVPSPNKSVC